MGLIVRFEDIKGWQEARELTRNVYSITSKPPFSKDFELVSQIRRASISIMANIAEGFDCASRVEFGRFLGYARRSAAEVQSLLYVAIDAGFIEHDTFEILFQQSESTKALIGGLMKSLTAKK